MDHLVDAPTLKGWLADGGEIALIDVREAGPFAAGHPFLAVPAPYSTFELRVGELAPNPHARMVLCDDGTGIAERARTRAAAMGYGKVFVLQGGAPAWRRAGYTLYEGVNVPSKTFGELTQHVRGTPHITADELIGMQERGDDLVIVDGRTFDEFRRFAIPGAISCPNGELALGIDDLAPGRGTTIVVNCAGRTRSIIGAQTLIDLGLENRVVALENGTQGWVLAGHELETGAARRWARGSSRPAEARRGHVRAHAEARGVGFAPAAEVAAWLADETRTTYLFDIRIEGEPAGAGGGMIHAPGGQLVQASDHWIGVRNARVVVADDELVRAPMVAAWLAGLGFEAHVLAGGVVAAATIPAPERPRARLAEPAPIAATALKLLVDGGAARVADLRPSAAYRAGHISGAKWLIRPQIGAARWARDTTVVLIADDPGMASLAAVDLAEAGVTDMALFGGSRDEWERAGLETVATPREPPDRARVDFVSFTHGRHHGDLEAARRYLDWELGLVGRLDEAERAVFRMRKD